MRKTVEQQDEIRRQFVLSLREKLNNPVFTFSSRLRGEVKRRFIHDAIHSEESMNKLVMKIFKFYYDSNPIPNEKS